MAKTQFRCVKCGGVTCKVSQFQAVGGEIAAFFKYNNKNFITVSCKNCGYTELYDAKHPYK